MPDFPTTQSQLNTARAAVDQAQVASLQAAALARQAQAALDSAMRQHNAHDRAGAAIVQQLSEAAIAATKAKQASLDSLANARGDLAAATAQFAAFSDPRQAIGLLSNSTPFLLFPVRIETRFRTTTSVPGRPGIAVAGAQHQLLVRIYPDDCSIDTFEPLPSANELSNVQAYWMNFFRAGGIQNDQLGAWANLVQTNGSGRAGWLIEHYQAVNLSAAPVKAAATDEVLIIPTTTPLNASEGAATSAYWKAYWLADGDAAKQAAAQGALVAVVGPARASDLVSNYVPFNLADKPSPPLKKSSVALSTAFVVFPAAPPTTSQSWSQAPQVRQFPDRFVVLGFSGGTQTVEAVGNAVTLPLYTGPDPNVDPKVNPSGAIHPNGADIFVPAELQWMVDFDAAVAAGMGVAVDLTPEQANAGFERLFVIGLQLSLTGDQGPTALQELLAHHKDGRVGLELIAQGTPAHNRTGTDSGYTSEEDPQASWNDRKNAPLFTVTPDENKKRDGQWLAEYLGIDPEFVATIHNSGGTDQTQERAMQRALWPATLGYWMNTLFTPNPGATSIFSDATIEEARSFFTQFVSGRGAVPAIRIGHQPYGILPVTAFSKIQWFQQQAPRLAFVSQKFEAGLYSILRQIDSDWKSMSQQAAWVGAPGDAHQTLLSLLALHPSSVEYYSRTAESASQLYNMLNVWALGPNWWQAVLQLALQGGAVTLLQRLGYTGSELPDLLNHFFLTDSPQIATIIDDLPLAETSPIRAYTDDGRNYIQWLIDAASSSLETLRAEAGFKGGKSPVALLYLYLRQALLLGYYDSSYNYHRDYNILDAAGLLGMRVEPNFIHIADAAASESRYAALYKTESRITGSPSMLISDHIRQNIGLAPQTAGLADQLDALKTLVRASTAELERLFAEHVDICSYRYDSWLLGLVNHHVTNLRASAVGQDGEKSTGGLLLGAYAWVEDLSPRPAPAAAQIAANLQSSFSGSTLFQDTGEGYIHAPSIPHANTAAVLRSGYMASVDAGDSETLKVNLSSDRVRLALSLIEGIRNGQSLGALLGYNFEVGLHDEYLVGEVDSFIFALRKAFPLVADSLAPTKTDPNVPIEAIEARNVVDGKKLVDHVQKTNNSTYPYGLSGLPLTNPGQQQALNDQTKALLDAYDALADVALAESVFQATQGNYSRVASTIDAYTTGNFPPEPAVVQTPPAGVGLTHRIGLHLQPGLTAAASATPRAKAEPAINAWLTSMLPPLSQIACTVTWTDPVTNAAFNQVITMHDLSLEPIDLLWLLKPDSVQAMAELDDRVTRFVKATWAPRPDTILEIQYMQAGPGQISVFETSPLLRNLRTLITQSRPLRATDMVRSNDASSANNTSLFTDKTRISTPFASLQTLSIDVTTFLTTLMASLKAPINVNAVLSTVDANLSLTVELLERAARLSVPQSGWGFAYAWLQVGFRDMLTKVSDLVKQWNQKLTQFNNALLNYGALGPGTTDAQRFAALQAAEQLVSTKFEPLPATPAMLLATVTGKRNAFSARLNDFKTVLATTDPSFAKLLTAITTLSVSEFDSQPFDFSAFPQRAVIVTQDMARVLSVISSALQDELMKVSAQLNAYDAAASDADKMKAFQTAAEIIFGQDFQTVPEFTVSAAQGGEWNNAYNYSTAGDLLTYLKGTLHIDFPVDEWMYGVARVRPMVRTWESTLMLTAAFNISAPQLTPIQLPYESIIPPAPWVAMQYPSTYTIDSDRLLYTALYQPGFDAAAHQCGLMLDEWTEVIPADTRDTAITFQYARPDNEPPQAILLVVSPQNEGTWQWQDLVAALGETLDLAKMRAVEPAQMDPTLYSRFLPATVMANTTRAITIATPLTAAAGSIAILEGELHA
jgi:hypothetical protein